MFNIFERKKKINTQLKNGIVDAALSANNIVTMDELDKKAKAERIKQPKLRFVFRDETTGKIYELKKFSFESFSKICKNKNYTWIYDYK